MHSRSCLVLGAVLCYIQLVRASTWAIFSDADCQTSVDTIVGQNGYPDGVCTNIETTAEDYGTYQGFQFITMDYGCAPTIYQPDTTSDSCSGYAIVAEIGTCYNTSWQWYSIDMCSTATSTASGSTATSTSESSSSSDSTSASITAGAIAGAVVGCVVGLASVGAVCAYLFWFRPKQRAKKRERLEKSGMGGAAAGGGRDSQAGEDGGTWGGRPKQDSWSPDGDMSKAVEMHHLPPELLTPTTPSELPSAVLAEVAGDGAGHELGSSPPPVELPGDHTFRTSASSRSSQEGEPRDQGLRSHYGPGGI